MKLKDRDTDRAFDNYVAAANAAPRLSREAERSLAEAYRASQDPKAAEALLVANLRYVVAIALGYRRYGLSLWDLVAEGNVAMMRALEKFDAGRDIRFVTYASHWIKAYMLNYVLRHSTIVGGGAGARRSKIFFPLNRARRELERRGLPRPEMVAQLAEQFSVSESAMEGMLTQLDSYDVSLDVPVHADSPGPLVDCLTDGVAEQEQLIADRQTRGPLKAAVRSALETLAPRERYIIERRLMADPEDQLSLQEIGTHMGISRERARQLERRAVRQLRDWFTRNASSLLADLFPTPLSPDPA